MIIFAAYISSMQPVYIEYNGLYYSYKGQMPPENQARNMNGVLTRRGYESIP